MKSKFMQLPRAVLVGRNALAEINKVCEDLKLRGNALVVSGEHTFRLAGRKATELLGRERSAEVVLVSEPSMDEVEKVRGIVAEKKIGFIAAVGGGKVIDVSKLAAKLAGIEFLSIPTAASHDGIASSRASIRNSEGSVSVEARAPLGVIADTGIIRKAPYKLLASGCGDILAKFSAVRDWEMARDRGEEFSEYAATLSRMTAQIIMDNCAMIRRNTEESTRRVVKALISSGVAMSIAGSSRPGSGSEHKFCHALDLIAPKPALHGEQCGVGAIMTTYLQGGNWRAIRAALKKVGAPTNAKELGIDEEHIIKALATAHKIRPERYTVLGKRGLSEKKAWQAARAVGVI